MLIRNISLNQLIDTLNKFASAAPRFVTSTASKSTEAFGSTKRSLSPTVETEITAKQATITVALPGFAKNQVALTRSGKAVNVTATRGTGPTAFKAEAVVSIPKGYDAAALSAVMENGLLTLVAPAVKPAAKEGAVRVEVK